MSQNCCYKLESKDPRLSFIQTGDQPDLDPSSSPGARHITVPVLLVSLHYIAWTAGSAPAPAAT
ncbi:hypothetical protein J6590_097403 [Homalodisca vitripennis]|nr:hypothetical protein J6590_097403 [Homalodisca vitripennis]